jgi:2-polyprenyl-6-methoxyphenol hydroxylase-like FAD-dependent oxidoreductase
VRTSPCGRSAHGLTTHSAGKDVGVWQLRDAAPYHTWVRGRAMLLGDAAHAMLPHQGAGAMSAIEDAEALAFALRGVPAAGVHAALQRAFRLRYKRASDCQAASRAECLFAPPNPQGGTQMFERWCYPGAERWEAERPDMILSEDSA